MTNHNGFFNDGEANDYFNAPSPFRLIVPLTRLFALSPHRQSPVYRLNLSRPLGLN